jgi:hypothetical protein
MNAPDRTASTDRPAHGGRAARAATPYARRARFPTRPRSAFTRVAYSAAHVVAESRAACPPIPGLRRASTGTRRCSIRRYLWSLGLGSPRRWTPAQRGMGLDWPTSLELIRRSDRRGARA